MPEDRKAGTDGWWALGMAYGLYVLLYTASYFLRVDATNYLGAVICLYVVFLMAPLRWEREPVFPLAVLLLIWPFVGIILGEAKSQFIYLFKHCFLILLFLGVRGLDLCPLPLSRYRKMFLYPLLGILFISLFFGFHKGRHSGVFANANNYSLMALGLLFLLDEAKDKFSLRRNVHLAVGFILVFTSTVGTFVGYLVAWGYRLRGKILKPKALAAGALVLLLGGGVLLFTGLGSAIVGNQMVQRVVGQWSSLTAYAPDAFSGSVDFESLSQTSVEGSGSGVWRLLHWTQALKTFLDQGPSVQLFGMGLGSFAGNFGLMAHNDYLRNLLEQGWLGFLLMGAFLLSLLKGIPEERRFGVVAFMVYCFVANVIDNILFMFLWVVFLATADRKSPT